jgi:hypothetical protein
VTGYELDGQGLINVDSLTVAKAAGAWSKLFNPSGDEEKNGKAIFPLSITS